MPYFSRTSIAKPEQDGVKRQASGRKPESNALYNFINEIKYFLIREFIINGIERSLNGSERDVRFFRAHNHCTDHIIINHKGFKGRPAAALK
jgi:hypothetical protein